MDYVYSVITILAGCGVFLLGFKLLSDNMEKEGFIDHHDHFVNSTPASEWRSCLEHAEEIGLGSRKYELEVMK